MWYLLFKSTKLQSHVRISACLCWIFYKANGQPFPCSFVNSQERSWRKTASRVSLYDFLVVLCIMFSVPSLSPGQVLFFLNKDLLLQRTVGFKRVLFKERLNCINKEHHLKSSRSFCGGTAPFKSLKKFPFHIKTLLITKEFVRIRKLCVRARLL